MMIKKVVIATHYFSPGTSQGFRDYCQRKKLDYLYIQQSLFGNVLTWSFGALNTFWQVVKSRKKYDFYMGSNSLNAFVGIILKKLKRVKKVAYFTPDWSERRFKNKFLNNFYHWLDYFCIKHADSVWNSSTIMSIDPIMQEREKRGYPKKWRSKQIQVSDGTDKVKTPPFNKINRYQIGFVGHLKKEMGVELLINAFPEIAEQLPKAKALVIGSGPLEEELRKKAQGLNIEFTGFMGDLSQVYKKLSKCAIAVAPYEDDPENISRYSDPGKVKNYLSVGLPMVITKVPQVAFEIEKEKCGITINYNKDEFVEAVVELLKNEVFLKTYRKNVRRLAKKYSWDNIFDKALSTLE